jgi:hypothetical protein
VFLFTVYFSCHYPVFICLFICLFVLTDFVLHRSDVMLMESQENVDSAHVPQRVSQVDCAGTAQDAARHCMAGAQYFKERARELNYDSQFNGAIYDKLSARPRLDYRGG